MEGKSLLSHYLKTFKTLLLINTLQTISPFSKSLPNTKSEVSISHHSFWRQGRGCTDRLKQKSHSNVDVPKKQLKKYIYLKFKKHNILQKRKEPPSEENWGGKAQVIFLSIKTWWGENINNCARRLCPGSHTTHCNKTV